MSEPYVGPDRRKGERRKAGAFHYRKGLAHRTGPDRRQTPAWIGREPGCPNCILARLRIATEDRRQTPADHSEIPPGNTPERIILEWMWERDMGNPDVVGLNTTYMAQARELAARIRQTPEEAPADTCTGDGAQWCPVCGDCECDGMEGDDHYEHNPVCPLHGSHTTHNRHA